MKRIQDWFNYIYSIASNFYELKELALGAYKEIKENYKKVTKRIDSILVAFEKDVKELNKLVKLNKKASDKELENLKLTIFSLRRDLENTKFPLPDFKGKQVRISEGDVNKTVLVLDIERVFSFKIEQEEGFYKDLVTYQDIISGEETEEEFNVFQSKIR